MMKINVFILAALVLACAVAQEQDATQVAQKKDAVVVVKQDSAINVDSYNFDFETSDGTARQEQGEYKNDTDAQGLVVRGSYNYTAPDGQLISVTYLADTNGFQPKEHIGNDQPKEPAQPQA